MRRKPKSRHSPISLLRGAIGQKDSTPLAKALETFKARGQVSKFPTVYAQASHSVAFSPAFTAGRKQAEVGRLGGGRVLKPAAFYRELQWAAVAVYFSRKLIEDFLPLRVEFFRMVAKGDFIKAELALDEITKSCGQSLWVVENRIALLSSFAGFDTQKKFVNTITRKYARSNIAFMTSSISERNEPRVRALDFDQRLRARSREWELPSAQITHIYYRLLNQIPSNAVDFASVLAYEGSYSAIDLYETLLDVLQRWKRTSFFSQALAADVLDYLRSIADTRLGRLRSYILNEKIESSEPKYVTEFRAQNYLLATECSEEVLISRPWDLGAMVTISKLQDSIKHELSWLGHDLAPKLHAFFAGSSDSAEAVDAIKKTAINYRHSALSLPLQTLMTSRSYAKFDRATETASTISIWEDYSGLVEYPFSTDSDHLPDASLNILSDYDNASAMNFSIANQRLEDGLSKARFLYASPLSYYRVLGKCYETNILAKLLRVADAIEQSIAALIDHPGMVEHTPLLELLKDRGFRDLKEMKGNPSLTIAFQVYMEATERTDKEVALKVAWKRYLASRGVTKPSQLTPADGKEFSAVELYFLREVCHQEAMELGEFESQADLDKERMAICVILAKSLPSLEGVFNHEIVDLTRRINIEEGVVYLESSRVYVDEIGIQKWAKKNLSSQYLRYMDYLTAGLFLSVRELEQDLQKVVAGAKNRKVALSSYLDDYDVSADTLLESVIRELSQAFLQLPRFGLDAFLSSRIRHGSFVGYARGPLEAKRIVTKKLESSNRYEDNDYILDRWQIVDELNRRSMNQRLATLSDTIDKLLDNLVNQKLHVHSKNRPEGMVWLGAEKGAGATIVKRWLLTLKTTLSRDATLDHVTSYCLHNFFWPSLSYSLEQLKNYIQGEFCAALCGACDAFYRSTKNIVEEGIRETIQADMMRAKADIRASLKRVASWFELPQGNAQALSMPLIRALEIGLISTRNARPEFEPEVVWEQDEMANVVISGPTIGAINDLAFLVFSNIAKHAGFDNLGPDQSPLIKARIENLEGLDTVMISVENQVSRRIRLSTIRAKLEISRRRIETRDYASIATDPDGTGLLRIAQFLDGFEDDLSFSISDDHIFTVAFGLPKALIATL